MIGYEWLSKFVTVAILAGFSSVILVMLLGQSRVFYSMSHDGLVPKIFSDVHPQVPDAVQVEHAVLRVHGAVRRVHSRRHRRRDDQHRHAVRVHAGLRRRLDHARAAARPPARLHRAGAAGRRGARHRRLRRDDLRAGLDQLAAAGRLAGRSASSSTSATARTHSRLETQPEARIARVERGAAEAPLAAGRRAGASRSLLLARGHRRRHRRLHASSKGGARGTRST